jgi:hypothetical protein
VNRVTSLEDRMWRSYWLHAEVTFTRIWVGAAEHHIYHGCQRSAVVAAFAVRWAAAARLMYLFADPCS